MKNYLHLFFARVIVLAIIFCSFYFKSQSQNLIFSSGHTVVEAGVNFGPSFFLGDLGGNRGVGTKFVKDLNLQLTKLMKGAFVAVYPNDWFGLRIAANYTYVEGNDALITPEGGDEQYRWQRDLDFKSDIWELYSVAEIYPTMFQYNIDDDEKPKLRPYFFAGIGVFHFNPQGSLTDQNGKTTWYYLRPLHTEGEGFPEYPGRKEYALTQVNIPMGGGLKYFVSDNVNIGLELLYRKTFTDYIDDVSTTYIDPNLFDKYLSPQLAAIAKQIFDKAAGGSGSAEDRFLPGEQRGDPKNDDAYFSFALKIGIRIGGDPEYSLDFNQRERDQTKCPARF
jgi:hypothetical protein